MPNDNPAAALRDALMARFGEDFDIEPGLQGLDELGGIAAHRTHRRYRDKPVEPALLRLLCACALSAPAKSDLQQCDILIVKDRARRDRIADLIPDMPWIRSAPVFLVFLANGRRLPAISGLRGKPFPNDHLDQFFNTVADAAIVLAFFLRAAAAAGLGCCPISVIRDHSVAVSELLALPDRVIPLAGMCVGWPAEAGYITPRLSLASTLHVDRYDDSDFEARIDAYDRRRSAVHRYGAERDPARWGPAAFYGWSEDKARQYGVPQRADFGAFVRAKGFRLD
jgi:nitroreductase/FMN reductase [NAD(P)H]